MARRASGALLPAVQHRVDFIFYDVPTLRAALAERDAPMQARGEKPPSRIIDFGH